MMCSHWTAADSGLVDRPQSAPLFFSHVPKSGGTSLVGYLDRHFSASESFLQIIEGACNVDKLDISSDPYPLEPYRLVEIHRPLTYGAKFKRQPTTITVIRDPVTRLLSALAHWQRSNDPTNIRMLADATGPLDVFDRVSATYNRDIYNQASVYLDNCEGQCVTLAPLTALAGVNVVGTLPRLHEVCILLAGEFGWRPPAAAPILRARTSVNPNGTFRPEVLQQLRARSWADAALYEEADRLLDERGCALKTRLRRRFVGSTLAELVMAQYVDECRRDEDEVVLDFGAPLSGDGWHLRETNGQGLYWRWTGPGPVALVDLPVRPAEGLQIDVWIVNPGTAETLASLQFRVNGRQLPHALRIEENQHVARLSCPLDVASRGHALTLEIATPRQHVMPLVDPVTPVLCGIAVTRITARRI